MLVTTQCASYCRYCTRSRIVGDATQNFNRHDVEAQLDYCAVHRRFATFSSPAATP